LRALREARSRSFLLLFTVRRTSQRENIKKERKQERHHLSLSLSPSRSVYSPDSLCCRGSGGVSSGLGIARAAVISATPDRKFFCTGAVNGDGHVAPVYAKVLARITLCAGTCEDTHSVFKMPLASWVSLACLLVLRGCLLDPPGCLLNASWVPPGCLLCAWAHRSSP